MFKSDKLKSLSSIRMLYIEDDLETREELQYLLTQYVAELYAAKNGREGLDLYQKHFPDIVVTDIQMPEMNGLAMATEVRALNPEQAIVILSAHDDADYLFRALTLGIQHYITKPINIEQLLNTLVDISERKQIQQKFKIKSICCPNHSVSLILAVGLWSWRRGVLSGRMKCTVFMVLHQRRSDTLCQHCLI